MSDLRTVKTKRAINKAFLAALKKTDLNKITVSNLAERAEIGRGTFYLYYKDIMDLYENLIDSTFEEFGNVIDKFYPCDTAESMVELITSCIDYIDSEREIFSLLIRADDNGFASYKLNRFLIKKISQDEGKQEHTNLTSLENTFVSSGLVGLIERWVMDENTVSKQEFTEIICTLLRKQWEL